jgi:hypothetical protein
MLRLSPSLWLCAVTVTSLSGCGRRVAEAECLQLLDHYTEALVREERPEATAEQIAEMKSAARHGARFDPSFEFDRCSAKVTRRQFECAMAAPDVNAIERCLVL